jgi:hypothetical protein
MYQMRYDTMPPYAILSTQTISFNEIQRLNRFARYWDLIGNSGRFVHTLPLITAQQPFARFLQFSDAIFAITGSTWQIALKRLFELTYTVMTNTLGVSNDEAIKVLEKDYLRNGEKTLPNFLLAQDPPTIKRILTHKRQRLAIAEQ